MTVETLETKQKSGFLVVMNMPLGRDCGFKFVENSI